MIRKHCLKDRRALFFTIDAILAFSLIMLTLFLISKMYLRTEQQVNVNYASYDLVNVLSNIKIGSINNSYAQDLINKGVVKNYELNNSVLEMIGRLWVSGYKTEARELFENITYELLPEYYGIALYIDDTPVYEHNVSSREEVYSYSRMISGIEEQKPTEGYTARVFINSVNGKISNSYVFFGGLVGQGNITVYLNLPQNFTVSSAYMELDSGSNFSLFINNNYSGHYLEGCSDGGFMRAYKCQINDSYLTFFRSGLNTIKFVFDNNSNSYIGGGFFRVSFSTQELNFTDVSYDRTTNTATKKLWLPGISGVINLYSSFYVPGNLTSMNLFLNYTTNYPIFVKIGNTTVYDGEITNTTGNVSVLLTNSNFTSINYTDISSKTIPLRIGHKEVEELTIIGHEADIVLITDLSGSMRWKIGDDSDEDGVIRDCSDPHLYDNDTRRISLAKCLDKQFIDIVLNESEEAHNRIWLVDFNDQANYYFSENKTLLKNHVDNYPDSPSGGTCICCAINMAYNLLNTYSNSSRKKFVIVMTDGLATYCCGRELDYCIWWWCFYKCDPTGTSTTEEYWSSNCGGGSEDCTGDDCEGPIASTLNATERIHNDLNTTVYSIGFGPVVNCENANYTLQKIAELGNGSYYGSTDPNKLSEIYEQIAHEINNKSALYEYQKILAKNVFSQLHPNSYLEIVYHPTTPPLIYGKIPIRLETQNFGNTVTQGTLHIPNNVSVAEAFVTSYSSYYWTDNLTINGVRAFNLSEFGSTYTTLGDPFLVYIPTQHIISGDNSILISTASSLNNYTGGSPDDKAVYTILIKNYVSYTAAEENANGCNWLVYFEDNSNTTIKTPVSYSGNNTCVYNATQSGTNCIYDGSHTTNDAINKAVCEMLFLLDPDHNGRLNVNIDQDSLGFDIIVVSKVPSLWGPSIIKINVWG